MTTFNRFMVLIAIAAIITSLYFLAPILTPFLIAALLAYLGDPLVTKLTNWHIPRLFSVILVFLMLFIVLTLLVLVLIPLIQDQISTLILFVPNLLAWIQQTIIPWISGHLGVTDILNADTVKQTLAENLTKAGGAAAWTFKTILHSGVALIEWLTNLILIPVVTFYLLRDWDMVLKGIHDLLPRKIEGPITHLARECNEVLSAFFRGQLLVMLALGLIYSAGLSLMGLQLGLIIGMLAGLAAVVPYLGFIVGIIAASIAAVVQFGTWISLVEVATVFAVGQMLESMVLTPKLVGDRIGLHPVAVIFAVLAGASLFGFFGVLLALPVAAVIMVLIRFMHHHYRQSQFYRVR